MKAAIEQLKPLLEARQLAYDVLRKTFITEPSKDYLRSLEEFGIESFPFVDESEQIRKGVSSVKDYANEHDLLSESAYKNLHADYTRLFIGPHKLPAPPWESAYMNEERLLFQEETLRVRLAYLKYAFLPAQYQQEADDHLGLELDFMYRLNEMALEKLNATESNEIEGTERTERVKQFVENLRDQKRFLEEHLGQWVPRFSQDMAEAAKTEFYQGMAGILAGFLKLDLEALEELLGIEL